MRSDRMVMRFARLGWHRQAMLAEALAAIAAASIAVRFLSFERAVRLGSSRLAPSRPDSGEICREARWSVLAVASRVPWRAVCFQQGLALQWMLRPRGIDARLHYGIGYDSNGDLAAHVWVEAESAIILGAEDAPAFKPVATFP